MFILQGTLNVYVGDGAAFRVRIRGLLGQAVPLLDSIKASFTS